MPGVLLAAAICEPLRLAIPFTEAPPIDITPTVMNTMKATKRVYSIKSWPSSSCHTFPSSWCTVTSKVITTDYGTGIK
jgi:hypothetical protein